MYCRQCGFNNDKYSKMCKRCGSDLTRPVEDYSPRPSEPGKLRHAPKAESFTDLFKRRFKRLRRVAKDTKQLRAWIIAGAVTLVAVAAVILVPRVAACMAVEPDTYGDTAGNVATHSPAAVDGDYIYCSQPVGDNPGLYRIRISTGEMLKINWNTLSRMTWYDGWLYGLDESGTMVRFSGDGLERQQVLEEQNIRCASFYNGGLYYLDAYGAVMRVDLDSVSDEMPAEPELIKDVRACEMIIFDGSIYYIEQTGLCFEPDVPMDSIIDPEYEPGKISRITGKEIPPAYRVDAGSATKPAGNIYRIQPDGSGEELLVDEQVCNLSAYGDYLYYMTQTVQEVSASVFDHKAPASIVIRGSSSQFWRYNLITDKYTRFLNEGTARSALNVTDKGIVFISVKGDLEICPVTGGDKALLPTEAQNIDSFAVVNGVAYFSADSGTRVGWVNIDTKVHTTLWTAQWDPVVPAVSSSGDVSPSDAASGSDTAA